MIVPIFKKGDANDPKNYRGISLMSCFCKLFTSILNNRLIEWSSTNNIISDVQFGFQPNLSAVDAIFSLRSLITKFTQSRKKLYCFFIDYKKAFDSIIRSNLWIKIKHYGIHGKLLSIIQSMYSDIKTCVKSSGSISQFFENFVGLLQGEVLSPMLFALYVNDLENVFLNEGNMPIELNTLSLFNIMYADDMVICAESASELQNMLNTLSNYCIDWGLEVNVEKTKIVVFRNAGRASNEETWSFDGKIIQVVDQFTYLGILLNFNGKILLLKNS